MGIRMEIDLEEGYKKKENKRFGSVFVIKFINEENNSLKFTYAPKCIDKEFWNTAFALFDEYNKILNKIRDWRVTNGSQQGKAE